MVSPRRESTSESRRGSRRESRRESKRYSRDLGDTAVCRKSVSDKISEEIERRQSKSGERKSGSIQNDTDFLRLTKKHGRQQDIKSEVEKMRMSLPNYNLADIRQFRLPFHEALITNLDEAGYIDTAALIGALILYQDELRRESIPGSNIFVLPQIKFAKPELGILAKNLKEAEVFRRKESHCEECHTIIKLAVEFAFGNPDWWWLGEQIFVYCIRLSMSYSSKIGGKFEALSRYAYARYLIDNLKEYENASKQLKVAHTLSRNKIWNSKYYFPQERGTLYMQTNQAIFECLIREVKRIMYADTGRAIILADQARKRAAEACYRDGETRALVIKGICEMYENLPKSAINSFNRAIGIQERFGTIEGICKIRIHLAKAYLMDECANSSLNILMELKNDAEEHNLPFYLAQAYKNLAEYYLSIGDSDKASPLLEECMEIFQRLQIASDEVKVAENLRAISAGIQILPKYIDVLKKAGNDDTAGKRNLLSLLKWKNERQDFWDYGDLVVDYASCDDIILESLKKVKDSRPSVLDEKLRRLSIRTVTRKVKYSLKSDLEECKQIDPSNDIYSENPLSDNQFTSVVFTPTKD